MAAAPLTPQEAEAIRLEMLIDALCGAPDSVAKAEALGQYLTYLRGGLVVCRERLERLTRDQLITLYTDMKTQEIRGRRAETGEGPW